AFESGRALLGHRPSQRQFQCHQDCPAWPGTPHERAYGHPQGVLEAAWTQLYSYSFHALYHSVCRTQNFETQGLSRIRAVLNNESGGGMSFSQWERAAPKKGLGLSGHPDSASSLSFRRLDFQIQDTSDRASPGLEVFWISRARRRSDSASFDRP